MLMNMKSKASCLSEIGIDTTWIQPTEKSGFPSKIVLRGVTYENHY